ncbi:hypothetical protein [Nocardia cyriacigeorgica]|nr:hypothetical protein [Nocardia cyriacigeorgica]
MRLLDLPALLPAWRLRYCGAADYTSMSMSEMLDRLGVDPAELLAS